MYFPEDSRQREVVAKLKEYEVDQRTMHLLRREYLKFEGAD